MNISYKEIFKNPVLTINNNYMKTNRLKNYESPVIGILEVEVERGFAASKTFGGENGDWSAPF